MLETHKGCAAMWQSDQPLIEAAARIDGRAQTLRDLRDHSVSRRNLRNIAPSYSIWPTCLAPSLSNAPRFFRDGGNKHVTNGMRSSAMAKSSAFLEMQAPRPKASGRSTSPKSHSSPSFWKPPQPTYRPSDKNAQCPSPSRAQHSSFLATNPVAT